MSSTPRLSIILPTYNEAGNIVELIQQIRLRLPAEWPHEFWVIDDNSPDDTYNAVLNAFPGDPGVNALLKTHERGLAAAIKTGIQHAAGEYLLVMDSDFTHRPDEIPRMLHVAEFFDLVSGSRFCSGGAMTDRSHYIASFLYNIMLRLILRTQVQDNLGGFWVARRDYVCRLNMNLIFQGYGDYYFRLLKSVLEAGGVILEVPSNYAARRAGVSKSSFLKMLFTYLASALSFVYQRRCSNLPQ